MCLSISKFYRVWGSDPSQTMADFFWPFLGLFVGFLDFLFASFNNLWYYIIVQRSKTHEKWVILLIAWSWQNYDHCELETRPLIVWFFWSTNIRSLVSNWPLFPLKKQSLANNTSVKPWEVLLMIYYEELRNA